MDLEQYLSIPISVILIKLDCLPKGCKGPKALYLAPYRHDKKPSISINSANNTWFDRVDSTAGNGIDLIRRYLKSQNTDYTEIDIKRWFDKTILVGSKIREVETPDYTIQDERFKIRKTYPLSDAGLYYYLQNRGIKIEFAKTIFEEAIVYNSHTGKTFIALCHRNARKGYHINNPFVKACIGKQWLTYARGDTENAKYSASEIHIFKEVFDYLTALQHSNGSMKADSLILNSLCNLKAVPRYMDGFNYHTAYLWMKNNQDGDAAKKSIIDYLNSVGLKTVYQMDTVYKDHKDLNTWYVSQKGDNETD
ncbi:hypothetical protein JMG10_03485 [Nostoc ellipsosporum NOK]|nr:hypothetical protein [Nostoc ellipsosporum NOK]